MYYDPVEAMDRAALEELQVERLRETIENAKRSPFYAERFKSIDPNDIKTPADVAKLPFTTKDDLRSQYPHGLLTKPLEEFVRLHASSGTTGTPVAVFYTQKDLDTWADLMARSMYCCGCRKTDVLQNTSGYGLFTGGLGIHYGSERLGMLTIPAGAGNTKRQIKLIRDHQVTVPAHHPVLCPVFRPEGARGGVRTRRHAVAHRTHRRRTAHRGGPRAKIEKLMHIKAYNSYGLSEMNGPGVAFECVHQNGMHLWEGRPTSPRSSTPEDRANPWPRAKWASWS